MGGELAGDKAKLGFMYKAPETAPTKGSVIDLKKSFVEEVGDGGGEGDGDGIMYDEDDDEAAKEVRARHSYEPSRLATCLTQRYSSGV